MELREQRIRRCAFLRLMNTKAYHTSRPKSVVAALDVCKVELCFLRALTQGHPFEEAPLASPAKASSASPAKGGLGNLSI